MGRRGRRRKQILNDLKENSGSWKLKEKALDRTFWRTRFGTSHGPVARQTVEWINEWMNEPNERMNEWIWMNAYIHTYLHKYIIYKCGRGPHKTTWRVGDPCPRTFNLGTRCPQNIYITHNIQRPVDLSVTKLVTTRTADMFTWTWKSFSSQVPANAPKRWLKHANRRFAKCTFRIKGTVDLWSTLVPERPLKYDSQSNTASQQRRHHLLCKIVKP